jgi:hypothetical protein
MEQLRKLMMSSFDGRDIDLVDEAWHHGIPAQAGWYFIETDTPSFVLMNLPSPPSEYTNENGKQKKCLNYDIGSRATAMATIGDNALVINGAGLRAVYSGMATSLISRARDHTFAHRGTAGLALANYEPLRRFQWRFRYLQNSVPTLSPAHQEVLLRLGEQLWRATHGWPLLCSG